MRGAAPEKDSRTQKERGKPVVGFNWGEEREGNTEEKKVDITLIVFEKATLFYKLIFNLCIYKYMLCRY